MIFLFIIFIVFFVVLFYFMQQLYRDQKIYKEKIAVLQEKIAECNRKALLQNYQLQLTDELEKTLRTHRETINNDIFRLHYDLFELLSKNNLLNSRK